MLQLTLWPNPILLARCPEVTPEQIAEKKIDDLTFNEIHRQMFKIMRTFKGCGLAAPQANLSARIFITDLGELPFIINPVLSELKGRLPSEEGCLSLPGIPHGYVMRAERLVISGIGKNGETIWLKVKDRMLSRICQHEYDHLDGICYIDKMSVSDKENLKDVINARRNSGAHYLVPA